MSGKLVWWILPLVCGAAGLVGCAAFDKSISGVQSVQKGVETVEGTAKGVESKTKSGIDESKQRRGDLEKKGEGGAAGGGGGEAGDDGDPDGDGGRAKAKPSQVNAPITDEVNPRIGDEADWHVFELGSPPGPFLVELHWDDPSADLDVEIYDSFGSKIVPSPGKGEQPVKKIAAQIAQPGKYYVRVATVSGTSVYTFIGRWSGGSGPGAAGAPPVAAPAAGPAPVAGDPAAAVPGAVPGVAAAAAIPEDPTHPRARILQSYRDSHGKMVLYLDKGNAAGIKRGMTGVILQGADGDIPLDGGVFRITKVVDATKSVATSKVSKVGKNNRVVINLVP